MVKVAKIGSLIEWLDKNGLSQQGNVLHIYDNSVCVDLTNSPNYDPIEMNDKTIVAHKKYQIIG